MHAQGDRVRGGTSLGCWAVMHREQAECANPCPSRWECAAEAAPGSATAVGIVKFTTRWSNVPSSSLPNHCLVSFPFFGCKTSNQGHAIISDPVCVTVLCKVPLCMVLSGREQPHVRGTPLS